MTYEVYRLLHDEPVDMIGTVDADSDGEAFELAMDAYPPRLMEGETIDVQQVVQVKAAEQELPNIYDHVNQW